MWALYSYSEVFVGLAPFTEKYIIGIAENSTGKRVMVQIDDKYGEHLAIGLHGDICKRRINSKEVTVFIPMDIYKSSEDNDETDWCQ